MCEGSDVRPALSDRAREFQLILRSMRQIQYTSYAYDLDLTCKIFNFFITYESQFCFQIRILISGLYDGIGLIYFSLSSDSLHAIGIPF